MYVADPFPYSQSASKFRVLNELGLFPGVECILQENSFQNLAYLRWMPYASVIRKDQLHLG